MPSNQARKRRILVVANGAIGVSPKGQRFINKHTGKFLLDLKDRGLEPLYLGPSVPFDPSGDLLDFDLAAEGVANHVWDVSKKWRALAGLWSVLQSVLSCDIGYIFFPGTVGTYVARLMHLLKVPYGLYIRGAMLDPSPKQAVTLAHARFVLTVSPSLGEVATKYCKDVEVIRPMVSLDESDARPYRDYIGPDRPLRILYVGNIIREKGVFELLQACVLLKQSGVDFRCIIVGSGAMLEEVRQLVEAESLGNHFELHGLLSDKQDLMAIYEQADLFVFPSYAEGFPRVLYEAMIKGLPIITTLVGGIGGRMVDGVNCFAIPPREAEPIAAAIVALAAAPSSRRRIALAGQAMTLRILKECRDHGALVESRAVALTKHIG